MSTISQTNININNSSANASIASNVKGVGKTDAILNMIYFTDSSESVISVYGKEFNVVPYAGNVQLLKLLGDNAKALPTDKLYTLAAAVTAGYVSPTHQRDMASDTDKPVTVRKAVTQAIQTPLAIAKQAIIADLQSYIDMLNAGDDLITSLTKDGFADLTLTRVIDLSEARKANIALLNKEHLDRANALFNALDDTSGSITPTPDESIVIGNSKTLTVFEPSIDITDGKLIITIYGASAGEASKLLASRATSNGFTCKVTGGKGSATISYSI